MTIKVFPTEFELLDEDMDECVVEVKAVDEVAWEVKIKTVVTKESWPEISEAVMKCLQTVDGI